VLEERTAEHHSGLGGLGIGRTVKRRACRRELVLQLRTLLVDHRNCSGDALCSLKSAMQQEVCKHFVEQARFTANGAAEIILMSFDRTGGQA
jgi:hypothetical protein